MGWEAFLAGEGCEVNVPGLMGFVQYCVENMRETARLYGGDTWLARAAGVIQDFLDTQRGDDAGGHCKVSAVPRPHAL